MVGRRLRGEPRRARDDRDSQGQARSSFTSCSRSRARRTSRCRAFRSFIWTRRSSRTPTSPSSTSSFKRRRTRRCSTAWSSSRCRTRCRSATRRASIASSSRARPRFARAPGPHVLDLASVFAILTRLTKPQREGLDLTKKVKLYSDEDVEGFSRVGYPAHQGRVARGGLDGCEPALRHQRDLERNHAQRRRELDEHGHAARAQGFDRVRRAHGRGPQEAVDRVPRARTQGLLQPLGQGGRASRAVCIVPNRGARAARKVLGRGRGVARQARGGRSDHGRVAAAR